jgi:hypothetical protein
LRCFYTKHLYARHDLKDEIAARRVKDIVEHQRLVAADVL